MLQLVGLLFNQYLAILRLRERLAINDLQASSYIVTSGLYSKLVWHTFNATAGIAGKSTSMSIADFGTENVAEAAVISARCIATAQPDGQRESHLPTAADKFAASAMAVATNIVSVVSVAVLVAHDVCKKDCHVNVHQDCKSMTLHRLHMAANGLFSPYQYNTNIDLEGAHEVAN